MEEIRKAHNLVKRHLIQRVVGSFTGNTPHVLDAGCGFGGDIKKWMMLQNGVKLDMCDPSSDAIDEAQKRARIMRYNSIDFFCGDIKSCPRKKYNFICYNFSLHYIFENGKLFFQTLNEIKHKLAPGGILFGCIPDSEKILNSTPFQDSLGNFFARNEERTGHGNFGEKVFVQLVNTPYYEDGPKAEPIAYKDLLITHLELRGIILREWRDLESPHEISRLYSQFIFVSNN